MQHMWFCLFSGGNLRRHLKTHSGEKPNKCNQCDFASSQAGDLRRHLKMHRGEKPNNCNWCGYAFSVPDNLRRHKVEKANKCNQCDNVSSSHLKTENTVKNIHTNAASVNIYPLRRAIWNGHSQIDICKHNGEKSKQKQPVWLHIIRQAVWKDKCSPRVEESNMVDHCVITHSAVLEIWALTTISVIFAKLLLDQLRLFNIWTAFFLQ